jgi:negative regulator of sigma E activity
MHCNQEQIEALLDGELVGPEQDAVLAHLRDCPGCRSYYRQLLAMEQALRADTAPLPEDLLPDIMGRVHATSQRRRRQPWLRAAMGMAACLVVVLGIYLVRQQAEKGGDSPFSGILPDSSANNSVGADEDTFTDEVTPSDGGLAFSSGGTERQESSGPADYVLTGHPELAQQARQWLSQQGLEPDGDGVYPLTAQQVQDLNAAVPELELPTDDALRLLLED